MDKIQDQVEVLEKDKAPESTRDTIRAAIDEQKAKAASENDSPVREKPVEPQRADPPDKGKEAAEPTEIKPAEKKADTKEPEQLELDLGDKPKDKGPDVKEEPKKEVRAPFGLTKEIRAEWTNLKPEVQGYLAKVLKENLDLKSDAGRKAHLRDVDAVLAPYAPALEQWRVTPAQLVQRLLQYSDALASPQHKYQAIAKLANDFGVDLTVFGGQTQQVDPKNKGQQPQPQAYDYDDYIPPEVDSKLNLILNKFDTLETTQQHANNAAARSYVDNWAGFDPNTGEYTKRPYLPYVRQAMHDLIANGTIPIENGTVNLDAAYETACFMNQQVREHATEELSRINAKAEEQKRAKQLQAAQKARLAGSSIRSGAPLPSHNNNSSKPNSRQSIRDAIRSAVSEVSGSA